MPAPSLTRRERRWLVGIVGVAAAARIAWVAWATRAPVTLVDQSFYLYYGESIARGHGYTLPMTHQATAYYPIGYPAALAVLFWIARHTPLPDRVTWLASGFNVVLGVATVALVFEAARRLLRDNRVALTAAAIVALWPNLVFHTATALTETLFNALGLAAVVVLTGPGWAERRIGAGRLVAAGLLIGAATMVRPIAIELVGVAIVVWLVGGWGWRRALAQAGVLVAVAVVVMVPWTIRNAVRFHAFIPLSTNTGDNLCMSRQPHATGAFYLSDYCFGGYDDLPRPEYEKRRDAGARGKAIEFLRHHPGREVELWWPRTYYTFRHDHDGLQAVESYGHDPWLGARLRALLGRIADAYFFVALALAAAGWVVLRRRRSPGRLFVLLTIVAYAIPVLVFFGDVRFHVPLLPFVAMLAAAALVEGRDRVLSRSGAPAPPRPSPSG